MLEPTTELLDHSTINQCRVIPTLEHAHPLTGLLRPADLTVILIFLVAGATYFWNLQHWAFALIGDNQWGDAEFWWNCSLHLAEGIVENNPGKGYRPGYLMLAGAAITIFGYSFSVFHKCFIFFFLTCACSFYWVLRNSIGPLAATSAVAMLVFCPCTAEWIATSTTDATGLALHLLSLTLLLTAARKNFSLGSLALGGVVFSFAELTRPLMSPFIVVFAVAILAFSKLKPWSRIFTVSTLLATFIVPLIAWSAIQKVTIGEYSVSQNDSSAFFAASDPKIQVWTQDMYVGIEETARLRLHKLKLTENEVYDEFRLRTVQNYANPSNWRFHLSRLGANLWTLANQTAIHSHHPELDFRSFLLLITIVAFALERLLARNYRATAVALVFIGALAASGKQLGFLVILSILIACIDVVKRKEFTALSMVAIYWLTGTAALYLVGGTSGAPDHLESFSVNSLGYRLGMQHYFCIGLLVLFGANRLIFGVTDKKEKPVSLDRTCSWFFRPSKQCNDLTYGILAALFSLFALVELTGTTIIWQRYMERTITKAVVYPSFVPTAVPNRREGSSTKPLTITTPLDELETATGVLSSFIYNMPSQDRCMAFLYKQQNIFPIEMHPNRIIVEFPCHLDCKAWEGKKGVWILRRSKDLEPVSHEPYYWSGVSVTKFIPLAESNLRYEESCAAAFPLARYASQLVASGVITTSPNIKLEWYPDPNNHQRMRRLKLVPLKSGVATISIDVHNYRGNRWLTLNSAHSISQFRLGQTLKLKFSEQEHNRAFSTNLRSHRIDLSNKSIDRVVLEFANLPLDGTDLFELTLVTTQTN